MLSRKGDQLTWSIRTEAPDDADAISAVITRAFDGHPHSQGLEPAIVRRLRTSGALSVSIVAVADAQIIGYTALSPVTITQQHDGWFGLGPVAVDPKHQRNGIGSALVKNAFDALAMRGASGCVVVGDPAYYRRFGFVSDHRLTLDGIPPEYFMVRAFGAQAPAGEVRYNSAFDEKP